MARSRKNSYLFLTIVLVAALLLALTNPGVSDFKQWFQLQSELKAKGGNTGAVGGVMSAFGGLAGKVQSNAYVRSNLGLCSLYQSKNNKGEVVSSYLGLARTFIKLK